MAIPLSPDDSLYNAGTKCDMLSGPCSCGAWHFFECGVCGKKFDSPSVHCPGGIEAVRK